MLNKTELLMAPQLINLNGKSLEAFSAPLTLVVLSNVNMCFSFQKTGTVLRDSELFSRSVGFQTENEIKTSSGHRCILNSIIV